MDTDSFIFYVETEDFYKNIANDVNEWFDNSDIVIKKNGHYL